MGMKGFIRIIFTLFFWFFCSHGFSLDSIAIDESEGSSGKYVLMPNVRKQTIWGIGFEIQSDAIGSGNLGLPDKRIAVPHDLVQSERDRLARDMLKGFRYCRIAGGLYWRGLDADQKNLQPRWQGQLQEIRQMLDLAGIEGVSLEYWSPAPFWKANLKYFGDGRDDKYNTLRCFGPGFLHDPVYAGDTARFLKDFADACVRDVQTLENAGINVSMWGMQNEPHVSTTYSSCKYFKPENYVKAYTATASAIRSYDSSILLISDTEINGFPSMIATGMNDPETARLVDAYVVHTIGWDSEKVIPVHMRIREELPYRQWFQNEYEYLQGGTSPERCLNTVQHIMNSFQLAENPTWFWLHALKPYQNEEARGYSLGLWKSMIEKSTIELKPDDPLADKLNSLKEGHWIYNDFNWNAVGSFVKHMPWDCVALGVIEEQYNGDARIFAYMKPNGKRVIVVSNRSGKPYTFQIQTQLQNAQWQGYRYSPFERGEDCLGLRLGKKTGSELTTLLPHLTWEFWVEQ
ncbi:MAG: hypothetical protein JJU28_05325 [Cyclobacteriaceae bacterium]|nr:hypothetical protein [Cyclobacteriaceae bacterium]